MKNMLLGIVLLFSISQANAQVAIGFKASSNFTTYTNKGILNGLGKILKTPDGESSGVSYETGFSISGVLSFGVIKFIDIQVEPGFSVEDDLVALDEGIVIDHNLEVAKRVYIELPLKMKMRLPIIKDKLGIYSTIGVNTRHQSYFLKKSSSQKLELVGSNQPIENLEFRRMVGFGVDLLLGKHRFFVDSDFSTKLSKHNFEDFKLKDLQLGAGYLYEI